MTQRFRAHIELDFGGQIVWPMADLQLPSPWSHMKKALRAWLGVWGAAALCLPIPVIHLVFPPIGLVVGPFLGLLVYLKSRQEIESLQGEVLCPRCQHNFTLSLRSVQFPSYEACPQCKAGYSIFSWRKSING